MWNIFLYVYLPSVHFLVGGICSPLLLIFQFNSGQSLSRVWLCDPMDCSMPGVPVHHQLLELTRTHVHQVSDAIQPSHPLSSPSPPIFDLSQHRGLFQWVFVTWRDVKHSSFSKPLVVTYSTYFSGAQWSERTVSSYTCSLFTEQLAI